jgi:putative ABC transport system ATP-binding protein
LADEPTWALDTKTGDEVMWLITELWQEWKTVILITHEQEIADYAKRHILVKDGNIVNTLNSWLEWIVEHERKRIFNH